MARPPPVPSAPLPALVELLQTGVAEIGHEVNEPTDGGELSNKADARGVGVAPEGGVRSNDADARGMADDRGMGVAPEGGEPSNDADTEAKGVAALMSCSLVLLAEGDG